MTLLLENRNVTLLLACCMVFGLVLSLTVLLVPLYGLTLSKSVLILAVVVGVRPLASVLLSLPMGAFSDYFGRRSVIIGGFTFILIGCSVLAAAQSYPWLLCGQILIGMGDVGLLVAAYSLLTELAPPGRQYAVQGMGGAALQLGTILGPFAGGFAVRFLGFQPAFLAAGAMALSGLLLATSLERHPESRDPKTDLRKALADYHKKAWHLLTRKSAVQWAVAFDSVAHLTWPNFGISFYLAFLTSAGFSSAAAGSLMSVHLLVATLAQGSLGHLSRRASMITIALGATLLGAVTLAITPLLQSAALIVAVTCVAGLSRIQWPFVLGFVAENTAPEERATSVAILNLMWGWTSPCTLFLLGVLAEKTSLSAAFYATGALVMLLVGL
ncbi:MAG TPA: MFS transporter, partial [Anaerolineae bacterium]|nr:MFS transporter [Anaerolineae bacterium]